MNLPLILTLNAGSSSIKLGLFEQSAGHPQPVLKGSIDFQHDGLWLVLEQDGKKDQVGLTASHSDAGDYDDVLEQALACVGKRVQLERLACVSHRVVHGADRFVGPVLIDPATLKQISALTPLAPLHQPHNVRLIEAIGRLYPKLNQVASFDTAFHRHQSEVVRRYALPRDLFDEDVKRYGFHGLSYQSIAAKLARDYPKLAAGKVVVAHLGSGASLCAMTAGVSRDTSMGFSTLDGVPMGTRCGELDPGVLLYLLAQGKTAKQIETLLYHQSGLLGLSGISADTRVLLDSGRAEAKQALEVFTFRIAGEIARLATAIDGLESVVFTAGIGAHQPEIREAVCQRLRWLGVALDPESNRRNQPVVSLPGSRVTVLAIGTDEETVMATEAISQLSP